MKSLYLPPWDAFIRYHQLWGEGPPLVYLPGLSIPSTVNFLPVVTQPDLTAYHSLLIDYLGSGYSDQPADFDHSMENHARTIATVLDHEGLTGCTIIGHSMGGTVGIMLALLRPDLVSRLIVAEGNITPGGGALSSHVAAHSEAEWVQTAHAAFLADMRADAVEGDTMAALMCGAWDSADPAGFYRSSAALVHLDLAFKAQFLKLSIPRTFVYGEKSLAALSGSETADVPNLAELEAHGIDVAIVPNAGHAMNVDNLRGFVAVLKTALLSSNASNTP